MKIDLEELKGRIVEGKRGADHPALEWVPITPAERDEIVRRLEVLGEALREFLPIAREVCVKNNIGLPGTAGWGKRIERIDALLASVEERRGNESQHADIEGCPLCKTTCLSCGCVSPPSCGAMGIFCAVCEERRASVEEGG